MKLSPFISCIMPAYNASRFLRTAIDSILSQTYKNFELIIINDGSSDDTEDIIKSYNDPRIVYIKNDENLKLIKTLNKGIDAARGEFIARMDSDDQALPNLFERELDAFEKHPDAGIVNTLTWHMDEDGGKIRKNRRIIRLSERAIAVVLPIQNMISHPGVMVRTSLMKEFHYRDCTETMHVEDKDLWLRMFSRGIKCYTLKDRLLNYRESAGSINALYAKEREERNRIISQNYTSHCFNFKRPVFFRIMNWHQLIIAQGAYTRYFSYMRKKGFVSWKIFLELKKWQLIEFLASIKELLR